MNAVYVMYCECAHSSIRALRMMHAAPVCIGALQVLHAAYPYISALQMLCMSMCTCIREISSVTEASLAVCCCQELAFIPNPMQA